MWFANAKVLLKSAMVPEKSVSKNRERRDGMGRRLKKLTKIIVHARNSRQYPKLNSCSLKFCRSKYGHLQMLQE